jgi:hypothetical protein
MKNVLKDVNYKKVLGRMRYDMDAWIIKTNDVAMKATVKNK